MKSEDSTRSTQKNNKTLRPRQYKCGACNEEGHNARNCRKRIEQKKGLQTEESGHEVVEGYTEKATQNMKGGKRVGEMDYGMVATGVKDLDRQDSDVGGMGPPMMMMVQGAQGTQNHASTPDRGQYLRYPQQQRGMNPVSHQQHQPPQHQQQGPPQQSAGQHQLQHPQHLSQAQQQQQQQQHQQHQQHQQQQQQQHQHQQQQHHVMDGGGGMLSGYHQAYQRSGSGSVPMDARNSMNHLGQHLDINGHFNPVFDEKGSSIERALTAAERVVMDAGATVATAENTGEYESTSKQLQTAVDNLEKVAKCVQRYREVSEDIEASSLGSGEMEAMNRLRAHPDLQSGLLYH